MIKKVFFLLLFLLGFYNYAYADPISVGIFVATTFFSGSVIAFAATVAIIHLAIIGTIVYSIYATVSASHQKDKLKYPTSRYSAPIIDNTFSNEGIVPIIYGGPIVVGGNIIWQSDPGTTVQRFLALSIGEVSAITNVQIDEQDIAGLTGCSYTAYYGTASQTPDSRAGGVVKGLRHLAYLALTITAGDKVSSNPVVYCRVTGRKIKTWNSIINNWDSNAVSASKNPAAVIRDYLLLSTTLSGCGLSEDFIDNDSFGDAAETCDELVSNGAGGTEARYELDIIIDTKNPVLDNLAKMLVTFNGGLIRSAGKYKLVIEKANQTAVQAFTEDNITRGTFIYGYGKVEDTPNKLGVEWFSALEAKNPKRIAWVEDELDQEIHGVRNETISAMGIIRQSRANRLAKKIMYDRKINDIWCEFESNMSAMHCEPFDVVSVTHTRPNWTAALFRIIEINEASFGNAKYLCQAYNSSVLDDSYGTGFDDWDYGSPPNPYEAVPDVTNVALTEVGWANTDGTWVINIDVSWTAPASKKELLRLYIIELKKGSDAYKAYGVAPTSATTFRISGNLKPAETYYVRIKTQSKYDIISNGTVSNPITLVGNTAAPSNVENFSYSWGKNLELTWSIVTDYDLQGYEIRDEDANFGTDDSHLIYRGLTNKKVLIPSSRTPGTYYIKAINTSGIYSSASVHITPVNPAPAIPLSLEKAVVFNIGRLYWTDDTATDIEYYEVYESKTNAWAGEEVLYSRVSGKQASISGESSQNGMSDDNGVANTNYVTDLDLSGWGPDYWKGSYIEIVSGTGNGQELKISAYDTDLGKFTMISNWTTKPDTTSKFFLHPVRYYKVRGVDGFGPGNFTATCEVKYIEFTEGMLSDAIITARKIYAGEVITLSAQIKDAIITSAKIFSLAAEKITTGTLDAARIAANSITVSKLDTGIFGSGQLLDNGNFEDWTAGVSADRWTYYGPGGTVGRQDNPAYVKLGTYSAAITRVGANCYIRQSIILPKGLSYWKGRTITLGCWVKCATANVAQISIYDGVAGADSSYHTGDNTWQFLTVTCVISNSATVLDIYLFVSNTNTYAHFDGAMCVEGSYAMPYAGKIDERAAVVFYQTTAPTSGMKNGDYWIDTDGGNRFYFYQSNTWTDVQDKNKITTFRQPAVPTALAAGDLWIDTDDNKLYRATNAGDDQITAGEWELVNAAIATGWAHASDTTKIDGGDIYTGSVTANKITVTQLDALTVNTGSLNVDEIITVGTAGKVYIDGANEVIKVYDASNNLRVELGKLS